MLMKKLFLASSSELKEDQNEFEIFINRKNKEWIDHGIFLNLVVWEDFLDAVSKTRLQDDYNKAIQECDIFVMLFFTKVGQYTEEEFETAFKQFKATNKPFIFTYFKDAEINTGSANKKDLMSLWAFQEKLSTLGHFYTVYKNIDQLKYKFNQQLDKLAANGFIELKWEKGETSAPGGNTYQVDTGGGAYVGGSVSVGGDFVGRDRIVHGDQITTGAVSGTGIAIAGGSQSTVTTGLSRQELDSLFAPLMMALQATPPEKRTAALRQAEELKWETAKGKQADDGRIARLIDRLVELAPRAVSTIVSTFASPILSRIAGPVTKFVLEKIQKEP
jgi:hypothetical protein